MYEIAQEDTKYRG